MDAQQVLAAVAKAVLLNVFSEKHVNINHGNFNL